MAKISLIGQDLAKEGLEFEFVGPLVGCSPCAIRNVCFNLEPGKNYRITKVRDKLNNCFVFRGDKVKTVEVEEIGTTLTMQFGRSLQEGSTVTTRSIKCDYITCKYIETCNLMHMKEGRKVNVKKLVERVECPKGFDIRKVEVSLD
ncbi:MAG: UPF0179 family protein [Thermoplasmataceae archaeon]